MRVNKRTLIKMIREEVSRSSINEIGHGFNPALADLDPADLIDFADAWADLSNVVRSQVKLVLDVGPSADVNPNAISLALDKLQGFNEEIDRGLKEYMEDGHNTDEKYPSP